jgi:hypothetical protein
VEGTVVCVEAWWVEVVVVVEVVGGGSGCADCGESSGARESGEEIDGLGLLVRARVMVGEEGGGLLCRALRLLLLRDTGAESLVICTCFFPSGEARSRLNSAERECVRGAGGGVPPPSPRMEGTTPGLSTGLGDCGVGEISGENIAPLFLFS